MDLSSLAKGIIILGLFLVLAGVLIWLLGRSSLPLGRLPGDLRFQGQNLSCYAPLATTILLSILFTIVLNLVIRLLNR
jgi:hypothetical protein